MILYVKNMVCKRCIMVVENIVKELGLTLINIELGEVEIEQSNIKTIKKALQEKLSAVGFELLDDKNAQIIEKIKTLIIDLIQNKNNLLPTNLSVYLSDKLNMDYSMLSNLFSEVEGTTIEKFYIQQKIEKVKELLVYDELNLNEIASRLNYSSVAYLSNQFKKTTGLTPSHFKSLGKLKRKPLEEI